MSAFDFLPASAFDIETLATLYTRTFEGYVYSAIITPEMLATFIEIEDLKLELSPVLRVGETLAAFTTVGLRGAHAYCRGFGVVPEYRGKGLAYALCDRMVTNAWGAGASDMVLGVLKDNHGAVKTYRQGGFTPVRELHSVAWTRGERDSRPSRSLETVKVPGVREIEPRRTLEHFSELHPIPSIWNRDLPSLERMQGLQGYAVMGGVRPRAYLLFRADGDQAEVMDLAAPHMEDGVELLRALQEQTSHLVCHAEPEPCPSHAAFHACGFEVTARRYEMRVDRNNSRAGQGVDFSTGNDVK